MKKSILLGLLALSSTIFAAGATARVDVSANLIRAVEITPQSTTTQLTVTNTHTGEFKFPETTLDIVGSPGAAIALTVPQNLTLTKIGGTETTTANVTFGSGSVTTDGTNANSVQVLSAAGSVQNTLVISGNLASALEKGNYKGTIKIEANYN